MNEGSTVRVLLIEDDEDDFILTRDLLAELPGGSHSLEWVSTFSDGLNALKLNQHDVCLLDYRLGSRDGIELLRAAKEEGCQMPLILLTGMEGHAVDLQAMEAGADDYLVKSGLQASTLGRSIRYAIQRRRAAAVMAFEQARLSAFGADIGQAVARRDSLAPILDCCVASIIRYLDVGLAEIWVLNHQDGDLERCAAKGELLPNAEGQEIQPLVELPLNHLAGGHPVWVRQASGDPRIRDQDRVSRQRLRDALAYPLILEDRLIGVILVASVAALRETLPQELGSVASGIASCIERKRSDEALRDSELRYHRTVESIQEIIFQLDAFGMVKFLNSAWTSLTKFAVEETLGKPFQDFVHQEDRQKTQHILLTLMNRKLDYCRFETRFVTREGEVRWAEVFLQPTLAENAAVAGVAGSLTDVTERRRSEQQIEHLAAFPKVNPNPVLEFDPHGQLTYANEATQALADALGEGDLHKILPPDATEIAEACLATGQDRLCVELKIGDKTLTWSFFAIPAHRVVHCYGADITEMLLLEAQFRHAQKLESVGQLSAGIAHDFNNLLTVIVGYAEFLRDKDHGDESVRMALKEILDSAKRATSLTKQLLLFSRKEVVRPRLFDVNSLVEGLSNMLSRLVGQDIAVENDLAEGLPALEADAGMLEQAVMNLAVNARDAMPRGGELLIRTSLAEVGEAHAAEHPGARAGSFLCLEVSDTGTGMDEETLGHAFEPFFTTKEVGKGTGLGLATVHGIIQQHKGWIEVESRIEAGTTFRLYLPHAAVSASVPKAETTSGPMRPGNQERILLVDDEAGLREMVKTILESLNYNVVTAASGNDALQVWDRFDGRFDLLLSDVLMPEGMNGLELAQQFRARNPNLRVVLSSGYKEDALGDDLAEQGFRFLPKPYPPADLARLVRDCLDGPEPRQFSTGSPDREADPRVLVAAS